MPPSFSDPRRNAPPAASRDAAAAPASAASAGAGPAPLATRPVAPAPPVLEPRGVLALPGRAGALAVAAASGVVAAGDDRGEAGVWDPGGARLAAFRFRAPVASAGLDAAGTRAAFAAADGDAVAFGPDGAPLRFRVRPGDRLVVPPSGASVWAVTPATGEAEEIDPAGRARRNIACPAPVASATAPGGAPGLVVCTPSGVVARVAPGGELAWGGDYGCSAGCVASHPRGDTVAVALLARGVELLRTTNGARVARIDVGRSVECAALGTARIAFGSPDGTIHVCDAEGRVLGAARAPSRPRAVGVTDAGLVFALLDDGTVRVFALPGEAATAGAAAPRSASRVRVRRPLRVAPGARVLDPSFSPSGSHCVVVDGSRDIVVLSRDGSVVLESRAEGAVLAARVDDDGAADVVTTRDLRRVGPAGVSVVRRFGAEWTHAVWSDDGSMLASLDELGALRLSAGADASPLAEHPVPRRGGADRLVAARAAVAVGCRSGEILCAGPGWTRSARPHPDGRPVRVVLATDDGPVAAAGDEAVAWGWDGTVRWRVACAEAVETVCALVAGRLLVVCAASMFEVARDGRPDGPRVPRPEGRFGAAVRGAGLVAAWADGRRLVVGRAGEAPLVDTTWEQTVRSIVLSPCCTQAAVVLDREVLLVPFRR